MFKLHTTTQPSHLWIYWSDEAALSSGDALGFSSFFQGTPAYPASQVSGHEIKMWQIHQKISELRKSCPKGSLNICSFFRGNHQNSNKPSAVMLRLGFDFFSLPIFSQYSNIYLAGSWLIRDYHTANSSSSNAGIQTCSFITHRYKWWEDNSVWLSFV